MAKVKITNRKIVDSWGLIDNVSSKQLPAKVSYTICRNVDKLSSALKVYEKTRQKLLDQYAEKGPDGKRIVKGEAVQIAKGKEGKFHDEAKKLLELEADVDIRTFKLSEIENLSGITFSAAELRAIDFMISEKG